MIKLSGVTLRVKKIRGGRNGFFCLGELFTDIGDFRVADPLLDQFEDGDYTGTVWIERIFLKQYIYFGKGITELRATLHHLQLDSAADSPDDRAPHEADPADELPTTPPAAAAPPPGQAPSPAPQASTEQLRAQLKERLARGRKAREREASAQAGPTQPPAPASSPIPPVPAANENSALAELFAELWRQVEQREPVKLDSTVDRSRLRQQVSALQELGYAIDLKSQTWLPI